MAEKMTQGVMVMERRDNIIQERAFPHHSKGERKGKRSAHQSKGRKGKKG